MTNVYKQFEALLPRRPLEIGEVYAIGGDEAFVTLPSGGVLRVRGATGYSLGDKVFVREGAIEGKAPSLPMQTIDV